MNNSLKSVDAVETQNATPSSCNLSLLSHIPAIYSDMETVKAHSGLRSRNEQADCISAVKRQIYVLAAIIRKELALEISLYASADFVAPPLKRKPRFQWPFFTLTTNFAKPASSNTFDLLEN